MRPREPNALAKNRESAAQARALCFLAITGGPRYNISSPFAIEDRVTEIIPLFASGDHVTSIVPLFIGEPHYYNSGPFCIGGSLYCKSAPFCIRAPCYCNSACFALRDPVTVVVSVLHRGTTLLQ